MKWIKEHFRDRHNGSSEWKESETERSKGQAAAKGIRTGSENCKTSAQLPLERQEHLNLVAELQKGITSGSKFGGNQVQKGGTHQGAAPPVGFTCTRAEV